MINIIYEVDYTNRCFYIIENNKKVGIYLTNKQNKIFMSHLSRGVLVDFVVLKRKRKHNGVLMYRLDYFNKIIDLQSRRVVFDIKSLRRDMADFITKFDYYLFVDFEMTMPEYRDKGFYPEIIQLGYVLINKNGEIIEQDGLYVDTFEKKPLTNRTKRFLSIDQDFYDREKKPYIDFYNLLKRIITKYEPKIVTWGKNDQQVLNNSYEIHNVIPITNSLMFIDLLKLHKDYYRIQNDVGLFKTYQHYYKVSDVQSHDAQEDAHITFKVYEAFIKTMKE